MKDCQDPEKFKTEKSILSCRSNGQLGNQMSAFATLYGLSKFSNGKLRIGTNFKQFQVLSSAFPYFESHFKEYLMDSWYCGLKPSRMNQMTLDINTNVSISHLKQTCESLRTDRPFGYLIYLPTYINSPKTYYNFYQELKAIFQLSPKILEKSRKIIHGYKKRETSALIGIHVRSNDYNMHLRNMNVKPIGPRYYQRAISYFRGLYENPLFFVVSDSKETAMNFVIKPQQDMSKLTESTNNQYHIFVINSI